MGSITTALLHLMGIPWALLPGDPSAAVETVVRATRVMREEQTAFALLVRHGTIAASGATAVRSMPVSPAPAPPPRIPQPAHDPDAVLRTIQSSVEPGDAIIATTGYTGRALAALADRPGQFYMVGSMGCASSLGLGLAHAQPARRIVVIDGDGALLMRMGALTTIGGERPSNLFHVVLDNGVHESTGSQATASATTDLAAVAAASGYPVVHRVSALEQLGGTLSRRSRQLTFAHVRTRARTAGAPPRPAVAPPEVAARFKQWLEEVRCLEQAGSGCSIPVQSR
jgi:phosphonopyruvate decarboxylase